MKLHLLSLIALCVFFTFGDVSAFAIENEDYPVQRVRIAFTSPSGNVRPLLLGFTPNNAATDNYDYGYDAPNRDSYPNDMSWIIDGDKYIIQGVGEYKNSKKYELAVFLDETGEIAIDLYGLENFESEIPVFIYDSVMDTHTKINERSFKTNLDPGIYLNRFYIAFSTSNSTLSNPELTLEESVSIYKNGAEGDLVLEFDQVRKIDELTFFSMDGKIIYRKLKIESDKISFSSENLKGAPIVLQLIADNKVLSKKLFVE